MIINRLAYVRDGIELMRKLTFHRLWNYGKILISYRISLFSKRPVIWSGPFSLSFETASVCNLRCPECITGAGLTNRNNKLLSREFVSRKTQLHKSHAFYCNLYFQGEPFLNPDIFDAIKTAVSANYYTVISTNGHFLKEDQCYKIIESELHRIIISLDGSDKESYQSYRAGGSFEAVIKGIQRLASLKKAKGSPFPYLVIQFLVNKINENQLDQARTLSKKLGADELQFKSMQIYSSKGMSEFLPGKKQFRRYDSAGRLVKKPSNCFRLWSHMVYTSDGEAVLCCYDKEPNYPLGNKEENSMDIWRSERMQSFRKKILMGTDTPDICGNCGE